MLAREGRGEMLVGRGDMLVRKVRGDMLAREGREEERC